MKTAATTALLKLRQRALYALQWLALASLIAALAGSASALFLYGLDWASAARAASPWLLWGLPLSGLAASWLYLQVGRGAERGNNLLIDAIHDPQQTVPLRMAPLVLAATVAAHLCGASVGREGTAVQIGGALADGVRRLFRLSHEARATLLMAGISAGFASVFGTPLAGAVFGIEVLAIGRLRVDAWLPCLVAAVVADAIARSWGAVHTVYPHVAAPAFSVAGLAAIVVAGALFGLVGRGFAGATHWLGARAAGAIRWAPLRPVVGGIVLAVLATRFDLERYLGLGLPAIADALQHPVAAYDWAAKAATTIWSLGMGFKGGEVTPLFYLGATLGNALAPLLELPLPLLASVGFVAVFAGAANTPLAATLIAIELFGVEIGVWAAIGCAVSYLFSGHAGIYRAQRTGTGKPGG